MSILQVFQSFSYMMEMHMCRRPPKKKRHQIHWKFLFLEVKPKLLVLKRTRLQVATCEDKRKVGRLDSEQESHAQSLKDLLIMGAKCLMNSWGGLLLIYGKMLVYMKLQPDKLPKPGTESPKKLRGGSP